MSNEQENKDNTHQGTASADEAPTQTTSPGAQLKQAREQLGLSQKDVAGRLHLRFNSVVAVENDQLEEGVSLTFTKGYVRLYAKLVNLEAEPLLLAYDRMHSKETEPAKLHSFSRRVSREAQDSRWNLVSVFVGVLVVGCIVFWWFDQQGYFEGSGQKVTEAWDSLVGENQEQPQESNSLGESINTDEAETADIEPVIQEDVGPQLAEQVAEVPDTPTEASETIVESNQTQQESVVTVQEKLLDELSTKTQVTTELTRTTEQVEEPILPEVEVQETLVEKRNSADIVEGRYTGEGYLVNEDGTVDVVFTFTNDCWVSVTEATGRRIAVGVKKKGRVMAVKGKPPVRVVLGAPSAVQIDFGGQRVDMSLFSDKDSAKFLLPLESD